jgi:hypothetical protein
MPGIISNEEISGYISEKKLFDESFLRNFNPRVILGHKRKVIETIGAQGNKFRLFYRENVKYPLDFSVGLCLIQPDAEDFCLTRYNGKSHIHKNKCPAGERFYNFHIHIATKECQESGTHEEDFAIVTDKYTTARQALECLIRDCGFETKQASLSVFGGGT